MSVPALALYRGVLDGKQCFELIVNVGHVSRVHANVAMFTTFVVRDMRYITRVMNRRPLPSSQDIAPSYWSLLHARTCALRSLPKTYGEVILTASRGTEDAVHAVFQAVNARETERRVWAALNSRGSFGQFY